MRLADLPVLYDYAAWANDRVLTAAEGLPVEAWTRSIGHSFDSLQGTMAHILSSEILWLRRWQGQSPRERAVAAEEFPDPGALRRRWATAEQEMRRFLASLAGDDWAREVAYTTLEGAAATYPLWQMYLQVVNHGTHHRAEAAAMLTELGRPPEPLDLIFYFRQLRRAGG
jgi:uncharacterized damage-inducible protein DinB